VGAPPPPARGAAPVSTALALPPPLLSAHTLLAAAVRGFGIDATVTASGMRSPACSWQTGGPTALAGAPELCPGTYREGVWKSR
jgi:hypothetical protein